MVADLSPAYASVLVEAAQALLGSDQPLPAAATIVTALQEAEKIAKHAPAQSNWQGILGDWRLGFITGTRRSRQRAGVVLGAGRFLPRWLSIKISYRAATLEEDQPHPEPSGTVINQIELGPLQLSVTGPTRFWAKRNILSFDFTRLELAVFGKVLYQGYIRNGQDREASFYQQPLKEQAFFSYFLVQDQWIAARGKGGGLALWTRA